MYYWLLFAAHFVVMSFALVHALVYKRDHRAALGWIGIIVVFPLAGPIFYFLFGINRIRSKARFFAGHHLPFLHFGYERSGEPRISSPDAEILPPAQLLAVGQRVTGAPLNHSNTVSMLVNGEQFFPRLITTIDNAQHYVLLSSYLFSRSGIAGEVIAALSRAAGRGLRVYVLLDGVGSLYSLRLALRPLRRAGVKVALYIPPSLIPFSFAINLRNHRKIAVIDGETGFFGGINIDQRHMVEAPGNRHPTEDIHFEARGMMVGELQNVFIADWLVAAREALIDIQPPREDSGNVTCRVIDDGPDESLDYLAMTLLGVFGAARHRISIMVPYFLPSREMIASLQAARLRGVRVRIVLPERSNLRFVDWATRNMLWELISWDIEVYFKPAPFAHTKLIVIDDHYVMGGSANLDARSLRLNFELGVEMLDIDLAGQVKEYIDSAISSSRRLELKELDERPLWQRMRDAFFWLFSSYL